jgi:NADH:ubiquinone oxidoreductase subunit K
MFNTYIESVISIFFISGSIGLIFFYDNLIKVIISIEFIFLAGLLNLLDLDSEVRDLLFISGLSIATAETAIGLSLIISSMVTSPIISENRVLVEKINLK